MGMNDGAWERLFEKYNILEKIKEDGQFVISANTIKEFREPRLMTKFDHKVNLPEIFKNNSLAILPVTRGDYVISTFSAYKEFENVSADTLRVTIPAHLQSLISTNCNCSWSARRSNVQEKWSRSSAVFSFKTINHLHICAVIQMELRPLHLNMW